MKSFLETPAPLLLIWLCAMALAILISKGLMIAVFLIGGIGFAAFIMVTPWLQMWWDD